MCTRVLRRPIVFLRVRFSICGRCSILILLIKTVRCSIVRCSIPPVFLHPSGKIYLTVIKVYMHLFVTICTVHDNSDQYSKNYSARTCKTSFGILPCKIPSLYTYPFVLIVISFHEHIYILCV